MNLTQEKAFKNRKYHCSSAISVCPKSKSLKQSQLALLQKFYFQQDNAYLLEKKKKTRIQQ